MNLRNQYSLATLILGVVYAGTALSLIGFRHWPVHLANGAAFVALGFANILLEGLWGDSARMDFRDLADALLKAVVGALIVMSLTWLIDRQDYPDLLGVIAAVLLLPLILFVLRFVPSLH